MVHSNSNRAVTLCGQRLPGRQHICAFVDSRDEQYRILNPFFREGIEAGEEVVTIVESGFHGEHVSMASICSECGPADWPLTRPSQRDS